MSINSFLGKVNGYILNPIILLLFTLATLYFFYGIVQFLRADADDKGTGRIEARSAILWGLVGMFIMFSVYGIIGFVLDSFGIDRSAVPYLQNLLK